MAATIFILQSLIIQRIAKFKNYPIEQWCFGFLTIQQTIPPVVWTIIRHSEYPLRKVKIILVRESRAVWV